MSYMRRYLERQKREIKERMRRRAKKEREEEEDDEQVAMAVGMLHLSSQSCHCGSQVGHNPHMDRRKHSQSKNLLEDYFIKNSLYYTVDFRGRYRMHNFFAEKGQPPLDWKDRTSHMAFSRWRKSGLTPG
ncbi:unnamed protein product [Prunus armeniaca]